MNQFVQVVDVENDEPIELPAESDGTLLLSTLVAQFPGACGLKYRVSETNSLRGVRLADGHLYAPDNVWGGITFITVYPKDPAKTYDVTCGDEIKTEQQLSKKRKGDLFETSAVKTKKIDKQTKCSDLIVLGLPWKCAEEDLRSYFSQFGDLVMVQVKRDLKTNQSKGFGFIRFSDYESQLKALSQRHMIDSRWCDIRIPNSKEGAQLEVNQKVYVGRCTEDMTAEDFRSYFSQFGDVTDVFVPKPFRAFAFVTFTDPDVAQSLCGDDHVIKGTSVHLSCATPKNVERYTDRMMHGGGRGYGYGGGYGKMDDGWNSSSGAGRVKTSGTIGAMSGGSGFGSGGSGGGIGGASPFQLSPAMMAAAQAAFAQGLLGMMNNAGSSMGYGGGYGGQAGASVDVKSGQSGFGMAATNADGQSSSSGGYTGSMLSGSYGNSGNYGQWTTSSGQADGHSQNASWNQPRPPTSGSWN